MRKFIELYTEVMSVSTRKKMSKRMAKLARSPAVKMKKARTRLKVRSTAKLAIVARKQALKTIKLKYYPTYDEMPMAQRIKVDQKIQQKYGKAIDKIVRKKMTALKSSEVVRVAKAKEAKKDA
jgi:CRP-like cAMP-binding protein